MGILAGIKAVFGFSGVGESALKIVDKLAGTDWTAKEQAQFILDHAEKTKYQSVTRRTIATLYTLMWCLMILSWLSASVYGRAMDAPNAILLANDVATFMSSNINMAMNGILAFYFLIGVKR